MARARFGRKLALALILATLIFIAGFAASYSISYAKYQSALVSQEKLKYELLSLDVEKQLLTGSCELFDPYALSGELDRIGGTLALLEERFGKNDPAVLAQKKIYSLLETQHLLLIQEHNSACSDDIPIILFFYSNDEADREAAERVGFILTALKNKLDSIMLYSFDYDLESSIVNLLKKRYGVSQPNTVVINEKLLVVSPDKIDDIEPYIQ